MSFAMMHVSGYHRVLIEYDLSLKTRNISLAMSHVTCDVDIVN